MTKQKLSPSQQRMLDEAIELAELGLACSPGRLPEKYRHFMSGHVIASHLINQTGVRVTTLMALICKGYLHVAAFVGEDDILLSVNSRPTRPEEV